MYIYIIKIVDENNICSPITKIIRIDNKYINELIKNNQEGTFLIVVKSISYIQ